jgi:predicted methyltransferase
MKPSPCSGASTARQRSAAVAVTLLLGALSAATALAQTATGAAKLSTERIAEILASPDRSAADRTNDIRRKPAQMLAFIGIVPGMVAMDLSSGGGYTTELLARAVGPTGRVYGQSPRNVAAASGRASGVVRRFFSPRCSASRSLAARGSSRSGTC